jgi:hypothetical protein
MRVRVYLCGAALLDHPPYGAPYLNVPAIVDHGAHNGAVNECRAVSLYVQIAADRSVQVQDAVSGNGHIASRHPM